MRKILSIITIGFLCLSMLSVLTPYLGQAESSEPPAIEWEKTYGRDNDSDADCLIRTTDGGYASAGWTESHGAGKRDAWLVKVDSSGNVEWNQTYGGPETDAAAWLVQTSDGGYALCGNTYSYGEGRNDFWLVKTDAAGNMQWNKTYGGLSWDYGFSLVQCDDGGYALAGSTYSFGVGDADFWLVKTDSDGNHQWNKTYGGYSLDGAYSVVQTLDGGYALGGSEKSLDGGDLNFWLVKTNSTGDMEWNKSYAGSGYDIGYSMIQTTDGGYAMAGRTGAVDAGDQDFWLVKTNSTGDMEWDEIYGGTEEDEGRCVVQTFDGGYTLTGFIKSFGSGGTDAWIVKTDENGIMQWNETYGTSRDEGGHCVIQTSDGGYALAGYARSEAGDKDMWLIKLGREEIPAIVDIDPDTLNLKSEGHWITCYLELPEGFDVSDIDVSTVELNGEIPAELHPTEIGDYDEDSIPDLMVKFNRQDLIAILSAGEAALIVTGEVDGTPFGGTDTITVLDE